MKKSFGFIQAMRNCQKAIKIPLERDASLEQKVSNIG